ncbi:MAG: indolepyruvate oxidoreductase subunit beta [Clostridia bacterium]|nr:indolepyruvate oxidoreductase subunit beta [Clostridia bacterium]
MNKSCLLCGVGGQGTVLASRLIADAAMKGNMHVRTAETIGMAQRGGCVVSHVRIGEEIHSSLIPKHSADVLIGFEPAEAVRNSDYIKPNGVIIVNQRAIAPVTASLTEMSYRAEEMLDYLKQLDARVVILDGDQIMKQCGSSKVLNIALLGAAISTSELGITLEEMKDAIKRRVPQKFHDMNFMALELGSMQREQSLTI